MAHPRPVTIRLRAPRGSQRGLILASAIGFGAQPLNKVGERGVVRTKDAETVGIGKSAFEVARFDRILQERGQDLDIGRARKKRRRQDAARLIRLPRGLKGHPVDIGIAGLGCLKFGCALQAVDRFGVSLLPDEREAKGMMSRRGLGRVRDRLAQKSLRFSLAPGAL